MDTETSFVASTGMEIRIFLFMGANFYNRLRLGIVADGERASELGKMTFSRLGFCKSDGLVGS
jgi:hypothetical protein